jgi:arsenate reductase
MAEGLLRLHGGDIVEVASAGIHPRAVHPLAVRVLHEIGVDISGQQPKSVERFLSTPFDYVITLCDSAREACPVFPGAARQLHWSLPDPAATGGSDEEKLQAFRSVREEIILGLEELLADIFEGFLIRMASQPDGSHADALEQESA